MDGVDRDTESGGDEWSSVACISAVDLLDDSVRLDHGPTNP